MTKPWDWKPGKYYNPNRKPEDVKDRMEKRAEWEKKWDAIFDKKKFNNIEDNKGDDDEC
jgi:hypothetical protein